eukprot:gene12285-12421_t
MAAGWISALFAYNRVKMEATHHKNLALSKVLDDSDATTNANGQNSTESADVDPENLLNEEHLARLRAEADALDKATRLRVAQEQLAEYALEKSKSASSILQQAETVEQVLAALLAGNQENAEPQVIVQQLQRLKQQIADAALEAQAFSEQQQADVERLKRSSQQAELMDVDGAIEPKRAHRDGSESSCTDEQEQAAAVGHCRIVGHMLCQKLLEAALNVSEYTDKVDILAWRSKTSRVHAQIKDFCAILSGLVVAQDYKRGQQLVADRDFDENADFFQDVFEIGRRYKIMNPEKMRSEFGKLMYMLMDSSDSQVQELLAFSCVRPLRTVYTFLEERGRLNLLDDPLLETATREIVAGDRMRAVVQREIKHKERARETLARKYRHATLTEDEILWAIYSISDNNSYLLFNRDPIDRMISYFQAMFQPDSFEEGYSLAIVGGRGGARLTHSHERQYHYVLQSLMLWREISTDMFKLWYLAEADMLQEGASYKLCDTGQGLNRVQSAPRVGRAMTAILRRCQDAIGGWVGSSVVHLGDHNVPNALFFLNKYTQVPQILNPVVLVLDELPKLYQDPHLAAYINSTFGSLEGARKAILTDFCRHAFDGSGADNFFDAGSCIDGRLTSAWNWCSKIEKKDYHPLFKKVGRKIALQKDRQALVLCVVDVWDFDGSLPRAALTSLFPGVGGATASLPSDPEDLPFKLAVAVNKFDLLPTQATPQRVQQWVRSSARQVAAVWGSDSGGGGRRRRGSGKVLNVPDCWGTTWTITAGTRGLNLHPLNKA